MVFFDHKDLEYEYVWTSHSGNLGVTNYNVPCYASLNRRDGHEVLHFINSLGNQYNFCDKRTCNKVERMLHAAPGNICTQEGMRQWILRNWCHY